MIQKTKKIKKRYFGKKFYEKISRLWEDPLYQKLKILHAKYVMDVFLLMLNKKFIFKKILDFGCGGGFGLAMADRKLEPERLVGIDISKNMIRLAKSYLPKAEFIEGGVEQFKNFKDKEFDLIILVDILEHFRDPWQLLKIAGKKGKILAIKVPLEKTFLNWLLRKFTLISPYSFQYKHGHIQEFSKQEVIALVNKAKLQILNQKTLIPPPKIRFHPYVLKESEGNCCFCRPIKGLLIRIPKFLPNRISSFLYKIRNGEDLFLICTQK